MECDRIEALLSAYLDDELRPTPSQSVAEHLNDCDDCRQKLSDLHAVDRRLSSLRPPPGLADRIESALRTDRPATQRERVGRTGAAWTMLAAIAASILIVVMSQGKVEQPEPVATPLAANVVRATGAFDLLPPGSQDWASIPSSAPYPLPDGVRVRTGNDTLCEIETVEEGKIRVDRDAELIVHRSDQIELVKGQIWMTTPETASIDVLTPFDPADPSSQLWSMTCPASSEIQLKLDSDQAVCSSMSSQETLWDMGGVACAVAPGETVSVDVDRNIQRTAVPAVGAKTWQLPLLAVNQNAVAELSSVLQPLLAPIGRTKASHMHEKQIRSLGPAGALPLLAYAIGEPSRNQPDQRRSAVRLASDMADRTAIPLLQQLVDDSDGFVARRSREALLRLDGQSGQ